MTIATGSQALAADVLALTSSKTDIETRDMTAATGDVAYTGYGFKPKAIVAFAMIPGNIYGSKGFADENFDGQCIAICSSGGTTQQYTDTFLIYLGSDPTVNTQKAVLKSLDADGFTLTWTKTGTPGAATASIVILALMK